MPTRARHPRTRTFASVLRLLARTVELDFGVGGKGCVLLASLPLNSVWSFFFFLRLSALEANIVSVTVVSFLEWRLSLAVLGLT